METFAGSFLEVVWWIVATAAMLLSAWMFVELLVALWRRWRGK